MTDETTPPTSAAALAFARIGKAEAHPFLDGKLPQGEVPKGTVSAVKGDLPLQMVAEPERFLKLVYTVLRLGYGVEIQTPSPFYTCKLIVGSNERASHSDTSPLTALMGAAQFVGIKV